MQIRQVTVSDLPVLRALLETTFRDTYAAQNTPEDIEKHVLERFAANVITAEIKEKNVVYFLGEIETSAVAFAKLNLFQQLADVPTEQIVEIERFYVSRTHQGAALGRKLMEHCCAWSQQQGFEVVWLGVWEHNPNAIKFYERMGFGIVGTHVFVLGSDVQTDFVMTKNLT